MAEANQDLRPDDASILLLKLPPRILSGRVRFDAQATGKAVSRVRFELDGKPVLTKAGEPYSAELDLGASPRLHRLRAVALDAAGKELATDELIVNGGPHRFGVRFLDPVAGRSYGASVPVRAVVDLPEGEKLDRLEIYLNEDLVTTLYQAPFVQPVRLAKPGELAYVRAVAYLDNGAQAENAVVINAPASQEEVSVQLVELYTTVTDRRGRPVDGLEASAFRVFEDKVEQTVRRFERVSDQPIHVVVLLDTSTSMVEELADAEKAAQQFFSTVLTPRDRGAVITFNERPSLAARFTADQDLLADGLAGLKADGETALYDALVYGLFYCSGIPGKRALVLLSDGEDVASRYGYEDVVEYAR
ncbi:MAG TPA: VWA domain-containing protein, partial [Thermoanaerobaculia bacterium]|nr:VWA domain-containing protein [Thermoanaerobaculia bacterium]